MQNRQKTYNLGLPLVLAMMTTPAAQAEVRWDDQGILVPRSNRDDIRQAPCGKDAIDEDLRTDLTGGDTVELMWEETKERTSHFRIAFSPDGQNNFEQNILLDNIVDDQDGPIFAPSQVHKFKAMVKIPNIACDKCALQIVQVLASNKQNGNKDHDSDKNEFYSCSDVRISFVPPPPPPPTPPPPPPPDSDGGADPSATRPPAPSGFDVIVRRQALPQDDAISTEDDQQDAAATDQSNEDDSKGGDKKAPKTGDQP